MELGLDQAAYLRELERLNRLNVALRQVHRVIVDQPGRDELFQRVCEILVATGGFRLAWIGWLDAATRRLRPVAIAGDRDCLAGDPLADASMVSSPVAVERSGRRAAAVVPLQVSGEMVGSLSVHAGDVGGFEDREVALLTEAADELSFALSHLDLAAERRRAEDAVRKSEARYRSTLDSILEACQLLDFDWTYLYLNDAAAAQNRRPNAELLGRRMPDVWPGIEATAVYQHLHRCMTERRPRHDEIAFEFADGQTAWFDVRVRPVPEGIFVLSIDVTERRQAEAELRELNDSLERKILERTRDLEDARRRAESADRTKSAFLATMSHELRTPMNSIIGFTGLMLQGLAGPVTAEQRKQLGMVRGSARHLLELINDVLDISKIEAGQLDVQLAPVDVLAAIDRAITIVSPAAAKKGLALQVVAPPTLPPIASDRRRLDQILINLLANAIKFTDQGGATLTVDLVDDGAGVRVQVADTGVGIKPEELAQLFKPFRQVDTGLERQHEGTGLGLAISRRLAELLGGTVGADSVWGRGSVFTAILPLAGPRP